jgi:hypothetical protein
LELSSQKFSPYGRRRADRREKREEKEEEEEEESVKEE